MTAHVGERQIDDVRVRVHSNAVRVGTRVPLRDPCAPPFSSATTTDPYARSMPVGRSTDPPLDPLVVATITTVSRGLSGTRSVLPADAMPDHPIVALVGGEQGVADPGHALAE